MVKEHYGPGKVKVYSDMGEAAFGKKGRIMFSLTIIINQLLTCTGYIKFFIDQISQLLKTIEI